MLGRCPMHIITIAKDGKWPIPISDCEPTVPRDRSKKDVTQSTRTRVRTTVPVHVVDKAYIDYERAESTR